MLLCDYRHVTLEKNFSTHNDYVRFEVFTAVTMKKAVFWDVARCRSGVNPEDGGDTFLRKVG
jgi:hypothetical protein